MDYHKNKWGAKKNPVKHLKWADTRDQGLSSSRKSKYKSVLKIAKERPMKSPDRSGPPGLGWWQTDHWWIILSCSKSKSSLQMSNLGRQMKGGTTERGMFQTDEGKKKILVMMWTFIYGSQLIRKKWHLYPRTGQSQDVSAGFTNNARQVLSSKLNEKTDGVEWKP